MGTYFQSAFDLLLSFYKEKGGDDVYLIVFSYEAYKWPIFLYLRDHNNVNVCAYNVNYNI